jgi:hypothetical protein
MDELFRYLVVRPPRSSTTVQGAPLVPTIGSPLARGLAQAASEPEVRTARQVALRACYTYRKTTDYVTDPSQLNYHAEIADLRLRIEGAIQAGNKSKTAPGVSLSRANLGQLVNSSFQRKAADVIKQPAFTQDKSRVLDSILVTLLDGSADQSALTVLSGSAQIISLVERVAKNDATLDGANAVGNALDSQLVIAPPVAPWLFPERIKAVGIGDLKVVKQHIKAYEMGEISHIENVLLGELKKHTTEHALSNTQTFSMTNDTTTETTKDLQTTERFELKTEAENTVKEDTSVKAGVAISAKYGEVLTVKTNVDVAYDKATTDSTKTSIDHAKDVVSRTAVKITARVIQQQSRSTTETFTEKDEHTLDDTKGKTNTIGIYQWLNKVYQAQVFNYGPHLLLDLTVPEPAAFLIEAVTTAAKTAAPQKPPDIDFTLDQLSTDTTDLHYYGKYLQIYSVSGVVGPPADHTTVSKTFSAKGNDDANDNLVGNAEATIPENYQAKTAVVQGSYNVKKDFNSTNSGMNIFVGTKIAGFTWPTFTAQTMNLDSFEEGSIPIGLATFGVRDYTATIDILCGLTDEARNDWKAKTFGAIVEAYNNLLSTYQDQVKALAITGTTEGALGSNNVDINRKIERLEIKKSVLSLLYDLNFVPDPSKADPQSLLGFNGIVTDDPAPPPPPAIPEGFARPNPVTAENQGRIVRFLEEAFEWEQMVYFFYPYYWGRKETWHASSLRRNSDPLFANFLNAGEARVVLPVRPNLYEDVVWFLQWGQVWKGGDVPPITSADYLPIVEEIKAADDAPEGETPEGDPWEVRVPTDLVKLRTDGKLPGWKLPGSKVPIDPNWNWTADPADS